MPMAERHRKVLIVGASAAGLRCACRLARLEPEWDVRVLEAGEVFSYAACGLPYLLSGDLAGGEALRRTVYGVTRDASYFEAYKGIEVLTGHRAIAIDPAGRTLRVEGPRGEEEMGWDDLVLATGARPRRLEGQPDHPRVVNFHTWDDAGPLRQGLEQGRIGRVALVGAGLVGCELAEAFVGLWGAEVVLLEAAESPLPQILDRETGACAARHLRRNGVDLRLGCAPRQIRITEEGVALEVSGGTVEADMAIVAVGVAPSVGLAREADIELGASGAIAVDERLATSAPHVWAAGDCVEVSHAVLDRPAWLPLGSLANRQGRTLANILAGRPDRFPRVVGATAVKVFDCNVAAAGCTEAAARLEGLDARAVWVTVEDRAHYWPEAQVIQVKLVYESGTRRVLGVQAIGGGEVAKRADTATQLLASGATIDDLAHLEHAYAPPYAPAMEPLAVAAHVAQNQEDGIESVPPDSDLEGKKILDVRLAGEAAARPAPGGGAPQMEAGEIAGRLDEIDASTEIVVCERGTRSAEAVRLLRRHGIQARYVGGGLRWRFAAEKDEPS
jgi:NADPH-dependent 2,4-dienoyl-CoA reductase/sulfur reductase-like enzyme/rhodanese-related sulfurtransferase